MGLFDWLRGATAPQTPTRDLIWLTKAAKFTGIADALTRAKADTVVLAAHFEDTLDLLQMIAEKVTTSARLATTLVSDIPVALQKLSTPAGETVQIVVAERHLLASKDGNVADAVRHLPCQCEILFHISLEDALMRRFAGEWVQTTLRQLGMTESEAIESQMIARRIRDVQKKIESQSPGDQPARSAEEWIERNCRE